MPPRKEPKEAVVYPASKRKVPAYKPLRPSGVPRIPTTGSESSTKAAPPAARRKPVAKKPAKVVNDSEDESEDENDLDGPRSNGIRVPAMDDSSEDLDDIVTSKPASKAISMKPAPKRRKTTTHDASPMSLCSNSNNPDPPSRDDDPMPSQSDDTPSIPQPLLVRLLHESFADKNTKIDTDAIQVMQKYVEIFVREAIARTQLEKADKAERGDCIEQDASWLTLEDLEAVAPGLVLDF